MVGNVKYGAYIRGGRIGSLLWLCAGSAFAQFQPGTTNHFFAEGDTGASYLAYFPTSYNTNNPPPMMVYFDPAAWAEFGMEKLRPSCEAAGWVLVCPYVLSNDNLFDTRRAESEILWDARRRIPHNRSRVYLAGLSGGGWRANRVAHELPGEFAGVLPFGGWIGWYDEIDRFPDRLAVCTVNGINDSSKVEQEIVDQWYYTQTLVRVHHVYWYGGHDISVPGTVDVAIAWFNADYAATGSTFVSASASALASNCYLQATSAVAIGNYTAATTNAVEILWRYPESGLTRGADELIVALFGNETIRPQIALTNTPANAGPISHALMQRGLHYQDGFPREWGRAFHEAALVYSPTNARAMAELAGVFLNDAEWRHTEWTRAAALLAQAMQVSPSNFYVKQQVARYESEYGDAARAIAYGNAARSNYTASIHGQLGGYSWPLYYLDRELNDYRNHLAEAGAVPGVDNLQYFSPGISPGDRGGWHLTAGTMLYQNERVLNGCAAARLTGVAPAFAIKSFYGWTNATVWTDLYLWPGAPGGAWTTNRLPYETSPWRLDASRQLHVYDAGSGTWLSPVHAPLSTATWSRLTMREDYAARTWDLALNETPVATGLPFAYSTNVFTRVHVPIAGTNGLYIDTLAVSTNQPEPDADFDGMGDNWEQTNGLNPASALDAALDPDGDFYANWEEFQKRTGPTASNAPPDTGYDHVSVVGTFNQWNWSTNNLAQLLDTCHHTRWSGDIFVASTGRTEFAFGSELTSSSEAWGPEGSFTGSGLPFSLLAYRWSSASSAGRIGLTSPINGFVRFWIDVRSGELGAEFLGLNDADGDQLADEWEWAMSGSSTGVNPYENRDGDAYLAIDEYFNGRSPLVYDPFSNFTSISLPGTWNGWATDSYTMTLVADHVWRFITYLNSGYSAQYKFAANGNWTTNWGDNDASAAYPPYLGTAERDGANLNINAPTSDVVFIHFDDRTGRYSLGSDADDWDWDGMPDAWETTYFSNWWSQSGSGNVDGDRYANVAEYLNGTDPNVWNGWAADQTSMSVAGTFNGWNQAANNMSLVGNDLWRAEMTFTNVSGVQFKFAANGSWTTAWGDPAPPSTTIPLYGRGDVTPGSANIAVSEPLNGIYWFTFHPLSGRYALDYAPHYIVMKPTPALAAPTTGVALRWLSSTDCRYSIGFFTNLNAASSVLASNIPATPPMNTWTQAFPTDRGVFFIKLEP